MDDVESALLAGRAGTTGRVTSVDISDHLSELFFTLYSSRFEARVPEFLPKACGDDVSDGLLERLVW
ncbi:hypothetical protein ACFXA2_08120 [Micromonospora chalcea]|uniref:Uncharacterized protein n=1 Tax=Micromonospora echinospora TaxID=1877 RepID=A0ABR6MD39_MICEC|nr:hypothetical protein [Micromonospora echinospora]MBB5112550.1 hypothetical protein [Micromonospora echinospora]